MNVYKLKYQNKESAVIDLKLKQIIDDEDNYINGTQAVVECGKIVLTQGIYDDQGIEMTAPIFADGYHYDVMSSDEIIFEAEIIVNNPKHTFAGFTNTTSCMELI